MHPMLASAMLVLTIICKWC